MTADVVLDPADPDPLIMPWFAVVNDEIGDWALATADVPVSEVFRGSGRLVVGDFICEEVARRVATLHNADLVRQMPGGYIPDGYRALSADELAARDETPAIRAEALRIARALVAEYGMGDDPDGDPDEAFRLPPVRDVVDAETRGLW